RISVDPRFDLVTEMCDQALDRPSRGVAERANGMAFDLLGALQEHVDLTLMGAALGHTGQYPPHPSRSLAAGRALAAALMLVKIGDPRDRLDQVGRFVHDDDSGGSEAGTQLAETVEIHRRIDDLFRRHHANRRTTGNDGL